METWNPEKAASWNQAPKLHFRLDYDQKKAELFVTSLEGTALCDWQALQVGWKGLQLERARVSALAVSHAQCSDTEILPPSLL